MVQWGHKSNHFCAKSGTVTVHDSTGDQHVVPWFSAKERGAILCRTLCKELWNTSLPPLPKLSDIGLWTASVPGDEMGINRLKLLLNYFCVLLMNDML